MGNTTNKMILNENNLAVRTLLYPFINIYRCVSVWRYQFTKDFKIIKQMHNRYSGRRCFIIGNGPSLTVSDLELIKNEFSFGFNRIYEIFHMTSWRPDMYICVDKHILKECSDIFPKFDFPVLLSTSIRNKQLHLKNKNTVYITNYVPFLIHRYKRVKNIRFSSNAARCLYGGATVTYTAIQLAAYMGFKNIYLLGIDHTYSKRIASDGRLIIDNSIKDYFGPMRSMPYTIQAIDTVEAAYRSALLASHKGNFNIYNTTRSGKLELFERKSLEQVLQNNITKV